MPQEQRPKKLGQAAPQAALAWACGLRAWARARPKRLASQPGRFLTPREGTHHA